MTELRFTLTADASLLERALSASGRSFDKMRAQAVGAIKGVNDVFDNLRKEMASGFDANMAPLDDVARRAESVYNSTRTPRELFALKQREINELFRVGALDAETHSRALKKANHELVGTSTAYGKLRAGLGSAWQQAKGFVGVWAGFQGLRMIGQMSDEMLKLNAQIKRTTTSESEFKQVQGQLIGIADNTRTGLSETVTLYQRSAQAMDDYGRSNQDAVRFTDLINKSMVIGGAGAQQQSAALYQLSQALESGKLAGDEFKSVAENSPIVLDMLSQSLGVTRGQLREMSKDGKLTTDVIVDSMLKQSDAIETQFKKMPLTLGGVMNQAKTKLMSFLDSTVVQSGALTALATALSGVVHHFGTLVGVAGTAAAAFGVQALAGANLAGGMGNLASAALSASRALMAAAMSNPFTALVVVVGLAITALYEYRDTAVEINGMHTTIGEVASDTWEGIKITATEAMDAVEGWISEKISGILDWFGKPAVTWSDVWGGIRSFASLVMANVYDMTIGLSRNVASAFEWMAARAKAALSGIIAGATEAMNAAKNAGSALLRGDFSGALGAVKGANVMGAAKYAYDAAPKTEFTRASTKDFAAVGNFVGGVYEKGRNRRISQGLSQGYIENGSNGQKQLNAGGKHAAAGAAGANGGGGGKGKGGGKGGSDNRVSLWADELEGLKRDYQLNNQLREMSFADEVAFWSKKKALVAAGSKEARNIQKKIDELSFNDRKLSLKNEIEIEALGREHKQKIALEQIDDALAAAKFEQEMGVISARDLIEIDRQLEVKRAQILADGVRERMAILAKDPTKNAIEIAKLNQELQDIERAHQRKLTEIQREQVKESKARWQGLTDSMSSLWDKGLDAMMSGTLTWKNALKAIYVDMGRAFLKIGADELKGWMQRKFQQVVMARVFANQEKAIDRGVAQAKNQSLFGQLRVYVMNQLRKLLVARTTATQERMIEQTTAGGKQNLWIGGLQKLVGLKTQELAIAQTMETTKQGIETAGAAKSVGITIGAATPKIMANATTAATGAAASQAEIPIIGPILAIAAMAAMLAAVGGMTSKLPSARGGWHVPAGMNPLTQLHEKEMVLPAKHAAVIDNLANSGGATGTAATHHYSVPVNYYDNSGKLTPEDINRNSRHIARALEKELRKFTVKV